MLPVSSLSRAAYSLRNLLTQNIDEFVTIENIKIGHPSDTIKDIEALEENGLNLFFYDLNYDGYPADGLSEDPFYVRLNCLITAIGQKSTESEGGSDRDVSKGENELRLISEVMRILHEQPILSVADINQNEVAQLQIVPYTMNLDNLNHIWSTQNDTSYRLSVAYEMALVPVPNILPSERAPIVGDSSMVSWGTKTRDTENEKDGLISLKPEVEYLEIDTSGDDWMPHICFVEEISPTEDTLHYVFNVESNLVDELNILIAGNNNGTVKLVWNIWQRKTNNSIVVWKEDIPDVVVPLEKQIKDHVIPTDAFFPNRIDPDNIDSRRIFQVKLPVDVVQSDTKTWQAILYATHEWDHEEPVGSGVMKTELIKSNSVLLYGEVP